MSAGWLSSLIGGGMSLSAGFGEGLFNAYSARKAVRAQKMFMKNAIRWRMQDMQRAGLNPILAAYSGAPVPSAPQMASVRGGAEEAGAIISQAASRSSELQSAEKARMLMDMQGLREGAQAALAEEQAMSARWERESLGPARLGLISAQSGLTSAQAAHELVKKAVEEAGALPEAQAKGGFYTGAAGIPAYRFGQVHLPATFGVPFAISQTLRDFPGHTARESFSRMRDWSPRELGREMMLSEDWWRSRGER